MVMLLWVDGQLNVGRDEEDEGQAYRIPSPQTTPSAALAYQ